MAKMERLRVFKRIKMLEETIQQLRGPTSTASAGDPLHNHVIQILPTQVEDGHRELRRGTTCAGLRGAHLDAFGAAVARAVWQDSTREHDEGGMSTANKACLFIGCSCAILSGVLGALGTPWWVAPPLMVAATYLDVRHREKRGIEL